MPTPVIGALSPNRGAATGGYWVIASGTDLDTVTQIRFGWTMAPFIYQSPTQLSIYVPPDSINAASVYVWPQTATGALGAGTIFTYTGVGGGGLTGSPAATGTLAGITTPANAPIRRLADGTTRFLFFSVGGVLNWTMSLDGVAWAAPLAVAGAPTWASIIDIDVVADTLFVWSAVSGGIALRTYPLSTTGIGAGTTMTYSGTAGGMGAYTPLAARFDGTYWHVLVAATQTANSQRYLFMLGFTAGTALTLVARSQIGTGPLTAAQADLAVSPSRTYVAIAESGSHRFQVWPLLFTAPAGAALGTYGGISDPELSLLYTGADQRIAVNLDSSGNLDVVTRDGAAIAARKRVATNNYGQAYPLASGAAAGSYLGLCRDASVGTLYLFYESVANQAAGEIAAAYQIGGAWYQSQIVAAGSGGHHNPICGAVVVNAEIDLAYSEGTNPASGTIVYAAVGTAMPPQAPQAQAPSGPVDVGAIVFSWLYTNLSASNPQGWYQLQVRDPQNPTAPAIWDSGSVSSAAASVPYTGPGLTIGATYTWRVRVADSKTNGGAGTASDWSADMSFVPSHIPTLSILSIQVGGNTYVSSPTAIDQSNLLVNALYHQTDGNPASVDQLFIYPYPLPGPVQANGAGAVLSSPVHPEAPYVPDGGQIHLSLDATGVLANGRDYALIAAAADSVTGLVAFSPPFVVHTNFAAPAAISGQHLVTVEAIGAVVMTWVNPVALVASRVERAPAGSGEWVTLYDGPPITTYTSYPTLGEAFDYRVSAVNGAGLAAPITLGTDVVVGLFALGMILMDPLDPTQYVWLYGVDSWDATKFKLEDDIGSYVAENAKRPIAKIGPTDYYTASGNAFFVPADDVVFGQTVFGRDVVATLREIKRRGEVYLRARNGFTDYGLLTNFYEQSTEDIHYLVTWDWLSVDPPPGAAQ